MTQGAPWRWSSNDLVAKVSVEGLTGDCKGWERGLWEQKRSETVYELGI